MFHRYKIFREMASFSLPHPISVDGGNQPCAGKVTIAYIDMRFEDYNQSKNFSQYTPFWARLPGSSTYLIYHGDKGAELLDSQQAAPYIEQYKAAPNNWWKYAQALDKEYNPIKEPLKLRGDYEKIDPNVCRGNAIPVKIAAVPSMSS